MLARNHAALTGARVQRLAGRSYAQVRHALHRLAADGLVTRERHGQAFSYSLNRSHVLAAAIEAAAAAGDAVEDQLTAALQAWSPAPAAVVLFGSFARRDGNADSDIDVLVVRGDGTDEDDPLWSAQRYELARSLERWTGNTTQIVELASAELGEAIARGDELIAAVRRDGRVLAGPDLRVLLAQTAPEEPR